MANPKEMAVTATRPVYLTTPKEEKDEAKALGAKWDPSAMAWFAPPETNLTPLKKWLSNEDKAKYYEAPSQDPELVAEAVAYVKEKSDEIKKADYQETVSFGRDGGFDDGPRYQAYKNAVASELDINLDDMRAKWAQALNETKMREFKDAKVVTLHTSASKEGFAITNAEGGAVWAGKFFEREEGQPKNICDLNVVKKAIFVAGEIAKRAEKAGEKVKLNLVTSEEWLTAANGGQESAGRTGGRTNILNTAANEAGIAFFVDFDKTRPNHAAKTLAVGDIAKWRENIDSIELEQPEQGKAQSQSAGR